MFVGAAGCGKTVLVNEKLGHMDENFLITNVPFNYYYTSEMLQKILEKPLEKKAGRNYGEFLTFIACKRHSKFYKFSIFLGPPGNRKLIYFIDDMNMPEVDEYYTVQPHTLIRQHLDYHHW